VLAKLGLQLLDAVEIALLRCQGLGQPALDRREVAVPLLEGVLQGSDLGPQLGDPLHASLGGCL